MCYFIILGKTFFGLYKGFNQTYFILKDAAFLPGCISLKIFFYMFNSLLYTSIFVDFSTNVKKVHRKLFCFYDKIKISNLYIPVNTIYFLYMLNFRY